MSRKYRKYKALLIEAYVRDGICPSYKMTLSRYKKIKREDQRHKKSYKKLLRSLRKGAILEPLIDPEEYAIFE